MSCGCGNASCLGCGCGCGPKGSEIILNPVSSGIRPCSPLSNTCGQCASCSSFPCTCGQPSSPAPFYEATPQCQENHCQTVVFNYFATDICIQYSFNVPACGETATVYFPDVKKLLVGSYLWNGSFGYFEVTAFNSQTGQATLVNHCNDGNAAIGTTVPACTCFDVVDPPTPNNNPDNFPFVAIDFVAPANSDCITINVTSVSGLIAGSTIAIGAGEYVLDSIVSPTQIRICNTGMGITPGTTVVAKNGAGDYQYPITQLGQNACSQTPVAQGKVVICDNLVLKTLSGTTNGSVLTLVDHTTGVADYSNALNTSITSIQSSITTIEADMLCLPQVSIGDVPLLTINNLPLSMPDGHTEIQVNGAPLRTLTITGACPGALYHVKAHCAVTILPDILQTFSVFAVYHELELLWDFGANPATDTCGKAVWTQNYSDGNNISNTFPAPTTPLATYSQLTSPSPNYPLGYYQWDLEASCLVSAGAVLNLNLFYKALLGENAPPPSYTQASFQVSGYLEIFRRA